MANEKCAFNPLYSPADGRSKYKLDYIRSFFAYSCKRPIVVAPPCNTMTKLNLADNNCKQ